MRGEWGVDVREVMSSSYAEYIAEGERAGARFALFVPERSASSLTGGRMGTQTGRSIDFRDYRDYMPGDDLRWVDWSVYARTDRLIVKLYHEEVNPHVDIVLDGSRSMALAESMKAEQALWLSALLATAGANAHCTHCCWLVHDSVREVPGGRTSPAAWRELDMTGTRPLAQVLAQQPPVLRRQGIRVLISDMLWPGDPGAVVRQLADRASAVFVLQVVSRRDIGAPDRGNVRLVDVESGETMELFVDAVVEERHRQALARHEQAWRDACRRVGARFVRLVAEDLAADGDVTPLREAQLIEVA